MSSIIYNHAKAQFLKGAINLEAGTIKVMLVTSSYTPNPDHDFVDAGGANDPIDAELSGTGYVAGLAGAGRKTLASPTVTESDSSDSASFFASPVTWTGINAGTFRYILVIKEGVADTSSQLIACLDPGQAYTTNGTDLTVTFNVAGLLGLA